jgi:hypothetical protein
MPPPPPRPKNAVVWILGIIGAGFVALVMIGFLFASIFIRHFNVDEKRNRLEIETPAGAIRVHAEDKNSTGLPVYPGARAVTDETANVDLELPAGAGVGIATEKYTTTDDLGKVTEWYAQKLGPAYHREEGGSSVRVGHTRASSDADVSFVTDSADHGNGERVVALTRRSGGVDIELVRVGKKEVQ